MVGLIPLTVSGQEQFVLDEDHQTFTFGRSPECDLALDETDRSISRIAGRIERSEGSWVLRNASTSRPLYLVDDVGLRRTLAVGSVAAIPPGHMRVMVVGTRTHELLLSVGEHPARVVGAVSNPLTSADHTLLPSVTPNERLALVALAETYLLPHPRHDPAPRTYGAAAARLGLPETTVRKRVENVREKLLDAGLFAVETADALAAVVEFALAVRMLTPKDLSLLDAPTD